MTDETRCWEEHMSELERSMRRQLEGLQQTVTTLRLAQEAVLAEAEELKTCEKAEADRYDVVLQHPGEKKILVIKAVRAALSLGLKDALDLIDGTPSTLKRGVTREEALALRCDLVVVGARVEVRGVTGLVLVPCPECGAGWAAYDGFAHQDAYLRTHADGCKGERR